MNNMYQYIDPGIIHFMLYPETMKGEGPILETLKTIAQDDYFTAVEVSWMKDPNVRKAAKELMHTARLDVYYGAQPRLLTASLDLNDANDEQRKQAVETVEEGLLEAIALGAKGFAFLSGKNVPDDQKEDAMERLTNSICHICDRAKQLDPNLNVVLEVFDYDIDKSALIGPVAMARQIAQKVTEKFDNFGLLADLSHLPLLRETPQESLVPIQPYLKHIHIGNAIMDKKHPAYGDSHPPFGAEGGVNDVDELIAFLKTLLEIGYLDGKTPKPVSFEVKPLPGQCPTVVLANAKRVLTKAWAAL